MKKVRYILGHSGAILTVVVAVVSPFLLYPWFEQAIGKSGLRVNPEFSGGEIARQIEHGTYRLAVYSPVRRSSPLQRVGPFIQMTWTPVSGLPANVSDDVDLDGDGAADVRVAFSPDASVVDVTPLNGRYRAMRSRGVTSFSSMIARVDHRIVVRLSVE